MRGSYAEPTFDAGKSLPVLAHHLHELAGFLGLDEVRVEPKGDLAAALSHEV